MNAKSTTLYRGAAAILVLGSVLACRATESSARPDTGVALKRTEELPESPLYARDGSVVQGAGAASEPRHDVGARDGSRMYLLELYQKTVEEKDGLAREVQSLHEAVSRAGETQSAIEKERDAARAQVAKLAQELERAQTENVDLAARLVTAQIRRLEAEKLVLEARIDALRRDASAATGTAIETAAPKGASASKSSTKSAGTEAAHGGGHP